MHACLKLTWCVYISTQEPHYFDLAPHRSIGPQKVKILLKFYRNINAPQGVTFVRFSQNLQSLYVVSGCVSCQKFGWICLKGLRRYGGFKLRGWVSPKFSVPLMAKLCSGPQKFWRSKNVLEVLHHHAKFGGVRISLTTGAAKTLSFLSVCLSVHHTLNVRFCAHDFTIKALEYRNNFYTIA